MPPFDAKYGLLLVCWRGPVALAEFHSNGSACGAAAVGIATNIRAAAYRGCWCCCSRLHVGNCYCCSRVATSIVDDVCGSGPVRVMGPVVLPPPTEAPALSRRQQFTPVPVVEPFDALPDVLPPPAGIAIR